MLLFRKARRTLRCSSAVCVWGDGKARGSNLGRLPRHSGLAHVRQVWGEDRPHGAAGVGAKGRKYHRWVGGSGGVDEVQIAEGRFESSVYFRDEGAGGVVLPERIDIPPGNGAPSSHLLPQMGCSHTGSCPASETHE